MLLILVRMLIVCYFIISFKLINICFYRKQLQIEKQNSHGFTAYIFSAGNFYRLLQNKRFLIIIPLALYGLLKILIDIHS